MNIDIGDAASIIAAIAATVAAVQVFVVYKQLKADHERSRRQMAIDLMQFFVGQQRDSKIRGLLAFTFFEQLTTDKTRLLYARDSFSVDVIWRDELNAYFSFRGISSPEVRESEVQLDVQHVRALASDVIQYLNLLEVVSTAWRHNTADREIIEEEFYSLFVVRKNKSVLEQLRIESGTFPSINLLVQKLLAKNKIVGSKEEIA